MDIGNQQRVIIVEPARPAPAPAGRITTPRLPAGRTPPIPRGGPGERRKPARGGVDAGRWATDREEQGPATP